MAAIPLETLPIFSPGQWPYLPAIERMALALGLGLFVGLEREWRRKEAGLRTFGLSALITCVGGMLGIEYSITSIILVALLVIFMNVQTLITKKSTILTTSAALLVTGYVGLLSGQGHSLTPVALAIMTAALLAWKERLADFSHVLTSSELRAAILMGILAFVIYPGLPEGKIDPSGLIDLRTAWVTVILIAAMGFANYILLKIYGPKGITITGFLGGLVNSTVTVAELATRAKQNRELMGTAFTGILLATGAMFMRNAILLGILAPAALGAALFPLLLMMLANFLAVFFQKKTAQTEAQTQPLPLDSPFSLRSTLKFGLIFIGLQGLGTAAQRGLGHYGFYIVSLLGGLISSASAVASAGVLARHGSITFQVAGVGALLASMMSALINLPLVARVLKERSFLKRLIIVLVLVSLSGLLGILLQSTVFPFNRMWNAAINSDTVGQIIRGIASPMPGS